MPEIKLGKYRHYKGKMYEAIGECVNSETREQLVIYKQLYEDPEFPKGSMWVRPKKMFMEGVIVGGKKVPRFKFVG